MKKRVLVVVDMQNDFVTGPLGTPEAVEIVPRIAEKLKNFDGVVTFTMDTHQDNYLETLEGRALPVPHCLEGSDGWEVVPDLGQYIQPGSVIDKDAFASVDLADALSDYSDDIESIELVGVCTDICVVSTALVLRAFMPNTPIRVDASCCAGTSPDRHMAALEVMRSCQIEVMDGGESA